MDRIIPLSCTISLLVLSIIAARFLNDFFITHVRPTPETISYRKKESLIIEKLLSTPLRQVDEICSELDHTCFVILDKVSLVKKKLLAYRELRRKGPQGVLTLSDARILPPQPLTWENFNTRTWKIDKTTVRLEYARLMIAGTFISGALDFNSVAKQDVLLVGLGGGVINNYLSTMPNHTIDVTVVDIDPVMEKIARKWYDFQPTPHHRIVIDDGVRFIREAARKGIKYGAVLVDVCYNVRRRMMCPIEEFLQDDVIATMRSIVIERGVVIVNIITAKDSVNEADRVNFLFSRYFPSCYLMSDGTIDRMLFCSAKENNSYLTNRDELYNRYIEIDKALGFQLLLKTKFTPKDIDGTVEQKE